MAINVKKRILIIGTSKKYVDGWQTMSLGLYTGLKKLNYQVMYLEGQDPKKRIRIFSMNVSSHLKFRFLSIFLDFLRITLLKFKFRPQNIIAIPEALTLPLFLSNFIIKIPYSIYSAGSYAAIMLTKRGPLARMAMDNCKYIFAMSEYTKNYYLKEKYKEGKIIVVKSGYDESNYKLNKKITKKYGHLLFVGNCKPRKGLHILIKAIKLLPKEISKEIILNIVTSKFDYTSYYNAYKDLLANVPDLKFKIHCDVSNQFLSTLYASSLLNILPSITEDPFFEGFGIIHSEAIASGCLTLGSLNSGNSCAIDNGNGFLIDQNDHNQLKIILQNVLSGKVELKPKGPSPKKWSYVVKKISENLEK